jgi:hypothetical protein
MPPLSWRGLRSVLMILGWEIAVVTPALIAFYYFVSGLVWRGLACSLLASAIALVGLLRIKTWLFEIGNNAKGTRTHA